MIHGLEVVYQNMTMTMQSNQAQSSNPRVPTEVDGAKPPAPPSWKPIRPYIPNPNGPTKVTDFFTKPDDVRGIMDLPPELHAASVKLLCVKDIRSTQLICRYFGCIVHNNKTSITKVVSDREIARLKRARDSYDYRGIPFLTALRHWIFTRGLTLLQLVNDADVFAHWYAQCHEETDRSIISNLSVFAVALIYIHFGHHQPYDLFNKDMIEDISVRAHLDYIGAVHDFPAYAQITKCGSDDDDIARVMADKSLLSIGTIRGRDQHIVQLPGGRVKFRDWHPSFTKIHLTTMDSGMNGSVRGIHNEDRLYDIFNLPLLRSNILTYCARDARTRAMAAKSISAIRIVRDPLDRARVLENIYLF